MQRLGVGDASESDERSWAISALHSPQQPSGHTHTHTYACTRVCGRSTRLPRLDVHMSTDFLHASSEGSLSPDILNKRL